MKCNCGKNIKDNFRDNNGNPICEDCFDEITEVCAICKKPFYTAETNRSGKYFFVLYAAGKNPNLKPGIYRSNPIALGDCATATMFEIAKFIQSQIEWIAEIPENAVGGEICLNCAMKYNR